MTVRIYWIERETEMTSKTKEMARFVRQMCKSLGEQVPPHWTDKQVLQFVVELLRTRELA